MFAVSASAANVSWTREMDAVWSTGENWAGGLPVTTELSVYDACAVANLDTTGAAEVSMQDLKIAMQTGLITVGGANTLTLGAGRFRMSNDTMGLAMEAVVASAAEQARNEASMQMLVVKGGADVNLSRIGMGDLTLSNANMFAATKVIEDEPLTVPVSLKEMKAGKLAFTEFGLMSAGAIQMLESVKFRGDAGVARAANRGGRNTVNVSIRGARNEGSKEKIVITSDSTPQLEAALKLSHGTGPMFFAGAHETSSQTKELVSVNDGSLGNITGTNTSIQPTIRVPKSARNLVAGAVIGNQGPDYATYIASTNPVAWWGMNESDGTTTVDLSGAFGAANNLTAGGLFNGTAVYPGGVPDPLGARNINLKYGPTAIINQPGYVRGTSNRATYFAGGANVDPNPTASVAFGHAPGPVTTGNMDAPNNAYLGAIYHYDGQTGFAGLSLEIWAKTNGSTSQDSERFIGSRAWGFGFQANGGFGGLHFTTFGKQDYFGAGMPTDNDWHQFGVSWTAATGNVAFYIDGIQTSTSTGAVNMLAINPSSINNAITVGGRPNGGQAFKGWIDEAVVWNTPRTAADFNASYLAALTPLTTAYWIGAISGVWNANVKNFAFNIEGTNYAKVPVSSITDVIFNANVAANFGNTTLGVDTTIKSLTFAGYTTASVGIGGGNTLTIAPATDRTGVTVESGSGTHTLSTNVALGVAQTWTVSDASQTLNMSGVISGAFSLFKSGAGTLVLAGNNINTGGTTVAQGTLALDYTTVGSKLTDAGVLTFAGGTVDLRNGATTHNEVVASTTISGGLSNVTRSSGTSVLRLNTITPSLGVLNFGADNIADTDNTNSNGILGGWATMGRTDWATNSTNAADGPITAYSGYTDINVRGASTIADGATTNVRLLGDGTSGSITLGSVSTTVNTLLQSNANFAGTVDTAGSALATNGIMIGLGKQALTIGATADSGMLKSATPGGAIFLNNFSTTNTLTVNAVIADNTSASGLGTVGVVILNGTNTYTGATIVDSGVLSVRNSAGLGGVAGGTSVQFGAALELQGGAGLSIGAESLTLSGTGINSGGVLRSISGNNTWTGTVTLAGDVRINSDAGSLTLNAASSITAIDRNLILGGAGNGAVTGSISTGAGTLTKDGSGTWTLSGANTYTCETKLSNGTLSVGANVNLGNGGALIFDGGTLKYTGASDTANRVLTINAGKIAIFDITQAGANLTVTGASPATTGALTKNGPGTLTLTGTQGYTGATNVNGGTFSFGGGSTLPTLASSAITLSNNSNVAFNHSDTATYSKAITGTGSFTKSGTGTLTLNVVQSYSGATFIDGGTLKLHSEPSYRYYRFSIYSLINSDLAQMSELAFYSSGTNNVNGTRVFPTTATGDGGNYGDQLIPSLSDNNLNTKCTYNGLPSSTQFGRYITFDFGATTVLSGYDWSTANDQTPNRNPNNFTLFGSNDGTTFTVVNAQTNAGSTPTTTFTWAPGWATGQISNPLPITTDLTISSTGTLALDGVNQQVTSLSGATGARVTNSGATDKTLTISGTSITNFSGVISNGATNKINLLKAGNGTQILTGTNTYTGTTTINAGTLQLGNGSTTGAISKDSNVVVNGTGTLAINRSNTATQGVDFGLITGTGGFTQAGSGTTIFSLVNTYTGQTTVNGGVLLVTGVGSISGSATVVNGGGTLGGTGTTGSVTVNGGVIAPGDPSAPGGIGDMTVNGNVSFSGSSALNIQFDYDLPGKDLLNLTGTGILTISSGAVLNLSVSVSDAVTIAAPYIGTPLTIIDYADGGWTSTGPGNNMFAGMNDDQTFIAPSGFTYRISYDGTGGVSEVTLTLEAIPEPGVAVSLLGGLGLLLGVRRRRA